MSEELEDEIRHAREEFERARSVLNNALPGNQAAGIEQVYGQAYQHMVRLDLVPQLKRKYRG